MDILWDQEEDAGQCCVSARGGLAASAPAPCRRMFSFFLSRIYSLRLLNCLNVRMDIKYNFPVCTVFLTSNMMSSKIGDKGYLFIMEICRRVYSTESGSGGFKESGSGSETYMTMYINLSFNFENIQVDTK